MPDLCSNFIQKVPLLLQVNSGMYLFEVLTIKLSLHKLISELNTHCMGVNKVNKHLKFKLKIKECLNVKNYHSFMPYCKQLELVQPVVQGPFT